jgi:hypothetical protein
MIKKRGGEKKVERGGRGHVQTKNWGRDRKDSNFFIS